MFLDGMGERESVAFELSDTVFFGDFRNVDMPSYSKVEKNGNSFYMVPFNKGRQTVGIAKIETPRRIVFCFKHNGKYTEYKCKSLQEAKSYFVRTFIQ